MKGDLPEDKWEVSNILVASELVEQSLLEIKEGLNTSFFEESVEIAQGLEVYPIPKIITPQGTFPMIDSMVDEDEEDNLPLS